LYDRVGRRLEEMAQIVSSWGKNEEKEEGTSREI